MKISPPINRKIIAYMASDRSGSLDLSGCTGLTALPDGLNVGGSLYLRGCTGLTALPDGLNVGGYLYLSGCAGLTALPDGFRINGLQIPIVPNIDASIAAAINAGGRLNMATWHSCETTHCRAGWAIHLAGAKGSELEKSIDSQGAGALIYLASRPGKSFPDFFASDEVALADIRRCAMAAE